MKIFGWKVTQMFNFIYILAFIIVDCLLLFAVVAATITLLRNDRKRRAIQRLRNEFMEQYGLLDLGGGIHIEKSDEFARQNAVRFRYPYWYMAKKDETEDKRYRYNTIIWETSLLCLDNYVVTSKRPYELLSLVRALRQTGIWIECSEEERQKYNDLYQKKLSIRQNTNIQSIINAYAQCPTDFEWFCADLFERMGYNARVTPPTRDGGYDIELTSEAGRYIVECKCYSPVHKVGRDKIQKLVGANVVMADGMMFITTSGFSADALHYASQVGVELIDGERLLQLIHEYMAVENDEITVDLEEWQLTVEDMKYYVPEDIYSAYFA